MRPSRAIPHLVIATTLAVAAGCGGDGDAAGQPRGDCPVEPLSVVVSVDQWGDIAEQLAGDCARVTTIVSGSTADPHDYEPTPGDTVEFEGADLVVVNGLSYDEWAEKAVGNTGGSPVVVDAGRTVGLRDGDNPHVWYGPEYVREVAAAVTTGLGDLAPGARDHFDRQHAEWQATMKPYDDRIASVSAEASGKAFAATEPVFDFMADAVGLSARTPTGYRNAALNESDPAPADIAAFEQLLEGGEVDVLIVNSQTEGPTPKRLRSIAEQADVPVVEVTETVPPGSDGFVDWQVGQLDALSEALGA